jgi:hypothetical protein
MAVKWKSGLISPNFFFLSGSEIFRANVLQPWCGLGLHFHSTHWYNIGARKTARYTNIFRQHYSIKIFYQTKWDLRGILYSNIIFKLDQLRNSWLLMYRPLKAFLNIKSFGYRLTHPRTHTHIRNKLTCNKRYISYYKNVIFEVFTAVTIKIAVIWDVVPCRSCVLTLVPRLRIFLPWRWRWYVPPKRRFTQDLHGATSQKIAFLL